MVILVLLKVDGKAGAPGGSVSVLCKALKPDPLFPDKVVLEGIEGLSWPMSGKFLNVQSWSVDRDAVLNWMAGSLQNEPTLTLDLLEGEKPVPWPPGTLPNQPLANDQAEIDALVPKIPDPPNPPEPKPSEPKPPEPPNPPEPKPPEPNPTEPKPPEPPAPPKAPKPKAKPKRASRKPRTKKPPKP